jgi:predicted ABC-type ATPase
MRRAPGPEKMNQKIQVLRVVSLEAKQSKSSFLGDLKIRLLKRRGYQVHFFFLWVSTVELALMRVRGRVSEGGHDIPENVVRRRFDRSIRNFLVHYRRLGDSWTLLDNSRATPTVIAIEKHGDHRIMELTLYENLLARYGKP